MLNVTHPGECLQDPRPGQLCGQEQLLHHEEEHPSLSQQHGPEHHLPLHKPQEHGQPPPLDMPHESPNKDLLAEMSRPGKCNEQPESAPEQPSPALMQVLGAQPCPEQQSSTGQCTPHIRQSSTIPLAVLRYDTVPATNIFMQKLTHNIPHPGECIQDPRPGQLCGQEHLPHHEEDHPSLSQQHGLNHHCPLDKPREHDQPPHHAQQNVTAHKPCPVQVPTANPPSTKSRPANQSSDESLTAEGGCQPAQQPCLPPKVRPANQSPARTLPAGGGSDPALPRSPPARPTNGSRLRISNPPGAKNKTTKLITPKLMKHWLERATPLLNAKSVNNGLTGTGGSHPPAPVAGNLTPTRKKMIRENKVGKLFSIFEKKSIKYAGTVDIDDETIEDGISNVDFGSKDILDRARTTEKKFDQEDEEIEDDKKLPDPDHCAAELAAGDTLDRPEVWPKLGTETRLSHTKIKTETSCDTTATSPSTSNLGFGIHTARGSTCLKICGTDSAGVIGQNRVKVRPSGQ